MVPYLDVIPSLSVDVDGSPGRFLLDTAGGITVLTPEYAADIGCAPWGQITGFRMRGDRLDLKRCDDVKPRIGETLLRIPTAGVWDLKTVLPAGAPELQGSLASDTFAGKTITLDLSAHRLTIETEASLAQRTASAVEVPVRFSMQLSSSRA